jgi:hypothetical protein
MIKNLIFVVFWPTTAFEEKKWCLNFLRQQGFTVEIYDLTYLLNSKAIARHPVEGVLQNNYIIKIKNYIELDERIRQSSSTSVFIDYMVNYSDIDMKTEKVFRILKRHKAKYIFISSGALPLASESIKYKDRVYLLLKKLQKASNPIKLTNFIARKIILLLTRHTGLYPLPYKIFGGDSDMLNQYILKRSIDKSHIVPIHSFDYDFYLDYMNSVNYMVPEYDQTCVYLDEAITHHPDDVLNNIKPIDEISYYASMNRLFEKIETETNLRVIIAAHPRSKYEKINNVFKGRKIIENKTIELVAKSSMTVTHASTSISFPILLNKPILFTKTSGMNVTGYSKLVDTMAASLGKEAIDIDDSISFDNLSFRQTDINANKYDEYTYKYIKAKNVGDLKVWEIIASELRSIN